MKTLAPSLSTSFGAVTLSDSFARRLVRRQLAALHDGQIVLRDGGGALRVGQRTKRCPLEVTVHVQDPRFYAELAWGGSLAAAESYVHGDWHADDLTALVRILLNNRDVLDGMEAGFAHVLTPARRALHWLNRNTRAGSRRNIAAHYDLGNDFFKLFLDSTLMYSSAVFERPDMTLEQASIAKLDRICRKLNLSRDDHVLEIGTGWGGFALYAAGRYGCHITTTTISRNQYTLARERVRAAGLEDRIEVIQQDYRDLTGSYDKLVSIEMIEAVGHEYYGEFFRRCADLLKPDGQMLLQAITIADQEYDRARREVDFIKRFIFPGSCIPSVTALTQAMTAASDLRTFDIDDIGQHYATTLRAWRDNFFTNIHKVRALGYDDQFVRMWEFYLCYCEGGFREAALSDVQMLLIKPGCRRAPLG